MALKHHVATLDGLDETLKAHYAAKDGKEGFWLDVTAADGYELADNSGLKSAHEKSKAKVLELKAELETTKADLEKAQAAKSAGKGDSDVDAVRAEMKAAHEAAIAEKDERIAQLDSDVFGLLIKSEGMRALQEGGFSQAAKLMFSQLSPSMRAGRDPESGLPVVEIINQDGTRRIGGADGSYMTVDQRVAELKDDQELGRYADGGGHSGTGQRGGETESVAPAGKKNDTRPAVERLAEAYERSA